MNILIEGLKALLKSLTTDQRTVIKKAVVDAYNAHADVPRFLKGFGPSRIEKTIDNLLNNL